MMARVSVRAATQMLVAHALVVCYLGRGTYASERAAARVVTFV